MHAVKKVGVLGVRAVTGFSLFAFSALLLLQGPRPGTLFFGLVGLVMLLLAGMWQKIG